MSGRINYYFSCIIHLQTFNIQTVHNLQCSLDSRPSGLNYPDIITSRTDVAVTAVQCYNSRSCGRCSCKPSNCIFENSSHRPECIFSAFHHSEHVQRCEQRSSLGRYEHVYRPSLLQLATQHFQLPFQDMHHLPAESQGCGLMTTTK